MRQWIGRYSADLQVYKRKNGHPEMLPIDMLDLHQFRFTARLTTQHTLLQSLADFVRIEGAFLSPYCLAIVCPCFV